MKRTWVAGIVVMVLCVTSLEGSPLEVAWLTKILNGLRTVNTTLVNINGVLDAHKKRMYQVYPRGVNDPILRFFGQVRDVQREIEELSCGWRFSRRTTRLWDGLYRGIRLCKPELERLVGAPRGAWDRDLREYYNYNMARRMNTIGQQHASATEDAAFADWLSREATRGKRPEDPGPWSPGYAKRLIALGVAFEGKLLTEQAQLLRDDLEREEEALWERRRREGLGRDLALGVYADLAAAGSAAPQPVFPGGE